MTKRTTKSEKLAAEAARLAALVADEGDVTKEPGLLRDPRLAVARQVWTDLAPRARSLGTLDAFSRLSFAILCVAFADYVAAEADILKNGFTKSVKTVSGDRMLRQNPALEIRARAERTIADMGRAFGLTLQDRIALRHRPGVLGAGPLFDVVDIEPITEPEIAAHTARWLQLTKPKSEAN